MSFENLNLTPPLLKILAKNGYIEPTPIQEKAIPIVNTGKDVIGKAPTGTGKTAVFVLRALELLRKAKQRTQPRVLILAPTRELAAQITEVIYQFGKELRVRTASVVGGMPYQRQLQALSRCDVIIATPGRLIDYMKRGNINFSHIELLVLDEADRMLDMGFIEDVKFIANATPKKRQTLLFTATLDNRLSQLAGDILKSPEHIEVERKKETVHHIKQRVYLADDNTHKIRLLKHLLSTENIYKAIIFSATKKNADDLVKQLRTLGYSVAALHGDMRQHKRNTTLRQFKQHLQLLIATDVAARGIDVTDISHVFIYDLSRFAEDHVHRIGRTGRAGKKGDAISLVLPSEGIHLQRIERLIKQTIPKETIEGLEPKKRLYIHKPSHASGKFQRTKSRYKSAAQSGAFSKPGFRKGFSKKEGYVQKKKPFIGKKTRKGD